MNLDPDQRTLGSASSTDVLYAYSDETEFQHARTDGRKRVGSAIFLTTQPVQTALIEEALATLASTDNLSPEERKTITRGYFHASADSTRAKLALAEVIRSRLTGTLLYFYRDPELRPQRKGKPKTHVVQELMLIFATLAMSSTRSRVELRIEKRGKVAHVEDPAWLERLYRQLEWGIYDTPGIPHYFPAIDIIVCEKTEPGLQVVDLLLWAVNRSNAVQTQDLAARGSDEWLTATGLEPAYGHVTEDRADRGGQYYIGCEVPYAHIMYPTGLPVPDTLGPNGIYTAWSLIERCLQHLQAKQLPDHATHYTERLRQATQVLAGPLEGVWVGVLRQVASVFIRLFDTIPMYEGLSPDDAEPWKHLLYARRVASLIQRVDLINGVTAVSRLSRWRRVAVAEHPEAFGLYSPAGTTQQ